MSDASWNAYNWNPAQPPQGGGGQDNFIYDGSGASKVRQQQQQQGGGQDNFIYDGSGAANQNNAWSREHPFNGPDGSRPNDRTRMRPAMTEVSPDGRTINVFYINNAYFNGQNFANGGNGGYDYRANPQYNYTRYDQNYQNMQQQEALNYYRPQNNWQMQMEQRQWQMQEWRREQQILAYQNYVRQQEMGNYGNQNWGGAGYNNYNNYNGYGYQPGGVGINLSFLFGGGRHRRG